MLFILFACMQTVLAAVVTQNLTVYVIPPVKDVAYLYVKNFRIDPNITAIFEAHNLTVHFINEKSLPQNFNNYDIIFVGNENFRRRNLIPVNDHRAIVVSRYNARDWGITDRDGVSQLGSTSPLSVVVSNSIKQVYIQAFREKRRSLIYYFIDVKNKAPNMITVASTPPTASGKKFGDVVSYAEAGTLLFNGKIQDERLCFYGIADSAFWTPNARKLFNDCVDYVSS